MGRHSAPDSEEEELSQPEVATTAVIAWGRHADAAVDVAEPDAVADQAPAPSPVPEPAAEPAHPREPKAPPHAGTRGDLQLLRDSRGLRLRCAAAVIVPFVVYTAILVGLGRTDVYLIWLWIPTVLAGVLVGAFLDIAHRRLRAAPDGGGAGDGAAVGSGERLVDDD